MIDAVKQSRSSPERARSSRDDRNERARLAAVLRSAGPDLEATAAVLDSPDDAAAFRPDCLDDARRVLLARLYRRSDDFTATAALKALDTFSADVRADAPAAAPASLQRAGLSGLQRMRR
jgi:hypothetical protein